MLFAPKTSICYPLHMGGGSVLKSCTCTKVVIFISISLNQCYWWTGFYIYACINIKLNWENKCHSLIY